MSKNATQDFAQGLAHDLRDVADDLRGIVETVVVPKVGSAVHAAAERVPDTVVDRLPARVVDHLPVQQHRRGRKLLLAAGLAALGAAAFAFSKRAQPSSSGSGSTASTPPTTSYPRPVAGDSPSPTDALDDPLTDPFASPPADSSPRRD
ncbi:MAG TPA: hypothetical protein VNS46_14690 [Nocardioides sp.]|nr:hypothetical protein [Nocardioides sp.]